MTSPIPLVSHLRSRILGALALSLVAIWLIEYLVNRSLLELPSTQLNALSWYAAGSLLGYWAVVALYLRWYLRPVILFLRRHKHQDERQIDARARQVALRFPLYAVLFGLALALPLIAIRLVVNIAVFEIHPSLAAGLAARTTSFTLAIGVVFYLALRGWMRPIIARFQGEQLPAGIRLTIRGKVTFALASLALAASIPMAVIATARLQVLQRISATNYREQLAAAIAHSATLLDADTVRELVAGLDLNGVEVRFGDRLAGVSAALPAGQRARFVQLHERAPPITDLTVTIVLAVLLFALAAYLARDLGATLGRDVRLVRDRLLVLVGRLEQQQPSEEELSPLPATAPQFAELRELAQAVNALLGRMAQMHVAHFVAMEKTLEADQLRTQFLANMSHDLRSPLNSILGFAELLLRGIEGELNDGQRAALDTINRNGRQLLRLINEVLDAAKVEAKRLQIHREATPPAEILSSALREVNLRRLPAEIRIETQIQPGMPVVKVDAPRLSEALGHLMRFCAVFAQRGTVAVRVEVRMPSDHQALATLRFVVSDSSAGVAAAEVEDLFVGFRHKLGGRGLGLELPLAKAFVQLHGGNLSLNRTAQGNVFVAEIPVIAEPLGERRR